MPKSKDLERGEIAAFARYIGEPADKVRRWKKSGKLEGCIKNRKIQKKKAKVAVYDSINIKKQQSQNARWNKDVEAPKPPGDIKDPETREEVKTYLDETVGDLSMLGFQELQRRNELEKLLMAQIKRRKEDEDLVEIAVVKKDVEDIVLTFRSQIASIPDRVSALLAAETDRNEVKRTLKKELGIALNSISEKVLVKDG